MKKPRLPIEQELQAMKHELQKAKAELRDARFEINEYREMNARVRQDRDTAQSKVNALEPENKSLKIWSDTLRHSAQYLCQHLDVVTTELRKCVEASRR